MSLPRPLEVRIVGLGLFLKALSLLSVLHCLPPIIGGSCHKYHFCRDKLLPPQITSFVATKVCLPRQNVFRFCVCLDSDVMVSFCFCKPCLYSLYYTACRLSSAGAATSTLFVATDFCRHKTRLLWRQKYVCRDKTFFRFCVCLESDVMLYCV